MNAGPFNQLPVKAEWMHRVEELAEAASQELKSAVLMIAMEPDQKIMVTVQGMPKEGPMAEAWALMEHDPVRILLFFAKVVMINEEAARREGAKQ